MTVHMFACCHSFCALIGCDSTSMCQSMTPIKSPQQIECCMLPTLSHTHKCSWSIHYWYWCLLTEINLWPHIPPHFSSPSFSTPPSPFFLLSQGYRRRYRLCIADQSQPTSSVCSWRRHNVTEKLQLRWANLSILLENTRVQSQWEKHNKIYMSSDEETKGQRAMNNRARRTNQSELMHQSDWELPCHWLV